jgi:hypothetical protein
VAHKRMFAGRVTGGNHRSRSERPALPGANVDPTTGRCVLGAHQVNAARARVSVFAVLGLMWVLVACADDDGAGASAEPETTETTSAEDARAEIEADVVAAYEAGWAAIIRASDPPDPEAAYLADVLVSEQLQRSQGALREHEAEGLVVRGTYETDATVTQLGEDTATVEDCALDQLELIVADTDEVVATFDDQRDGMVADLVLDGARGRSAT